MTEKYEQLIEENTQLKKALISSKALIDRISNDYETIRSIHDDTKLHYEKAKRDVVEWSTRAKSLLQDKRELEQQFDTTIRNLKMAIEQKQREIEEIQSKDMLRIRVINELEIPHRQQMEHKQLEIEKLQEQTYFLKRQVDLAEAKVESMVLETQKEIKVWDDKHRIDIEDYRQQVQELSRMVEDTTDRDSFRKTKRELDEYKMKYQAIQVENEELRIERDKVREDHNETLVKFSRQIDQERTDKRQFKSEAEKFSVRLRFTEDELRKEKMRRDQVLGDIDMVKSEKDSIFNELRKKDDTLNYLQNKIRELEEQNLTSEQKNHDNMLRLYNEEHDKYLQERNKAMTTMKDLENLKKRFSDQSDDYKQLKDRYLKDTQDIKEERNLMVEEKEKMKRNIIQMQRENQELERVNHSNNYINNLLFKVKEDQLKDQDNEFETIKKRNRELAHRLSLAETYGTEQKPTPNPTPTPTPNLIVDEKMSKRVQVLQEENEKNLNQVKKLKDKLKQANQKIMEMLTKKLHEKQQQPETVKQRQSPVKYTPPQYPPQYPLQYPPPYQQLEDDQILDQVRKITQQGPHDQFRPPYQY